MKVLIKNFDDFSRTGSYCKLSQKNLKTNFYFKECRRKMLVEFVIVRMYLHVYWRLHNFA